MSKFLTHEAIASKIFSREYTSGYGSAVAWEKQLTNTTPGLKLMCERMARDFDQTNAKLRKPYNSQSCDLWRCLIYFCLQLHKLKLK